MPAAAIVNALAPAASGAIAGLVVAALVHLFTFRREREARLQASSAERLRRWSEFQLKTLVEMQQHLEKVTPMAEDIVHKRAFRQGPRPADEELARLEGELMQAIMVMQMYARRTTDDRLYRATVDFGVNAVNLSRLPTVAAYSEHHEEFSEKYRVIAAYLGQLIADLKPADFETCGGQAEFWREFSEIKRTLL